MNLRVNKNTHNIDIPSPCMEHIKRTERARGNVLSGEIINCLI